MGDHTHAELSPDGSLIAYLRQAAQGEENVVDQTVIEDVKSRTQRTTADDSAAVLVF